MNTLNSFWHGVGRQLRCPTGRWGLLAGRIMAVANRVPNQIAIEALDVQPTDKVLELGFGPGMGIKALSRLALRGMVLGLDRSPEMVAQAQRSNRAAVAQGRVSLHRGSFEQLPWENGSVNKILAVNIAYFFGADAEAIREARRVLCLGGVAAIYATHRQTMSHWPFAGPETHTHIDENKLRCLLVRGGFSPAEVSIDRAALPFGVVGLLAVARKSTATLPFSQTTAPPRVVASY